MPATPNDKVTFAGSGVLSHVLNEDGLPVPVQGNDDGAVTTVGAGGAALATEATADRSADAEEAQLARTPELVTPGDGDPNVQAAPVAARLQGYSTGAWFNVPVYGAQPAADDLAFGARIVSTITLPVEVVSAQTATATPDGTAVGIVTRLAGITPEAVGEGGTGLDVAAYQKGTWSVDQGTATTSDKAWPTRIVDVAAHEARVSGHGKQHVSEPIRVASFTAKNVENLDLYGFIIAGGGAHQVHTATQSQEISVTSASGDSATWQSHTKYPLPVSTPYVAMGVVAFSDAGQVGQVREISLGDSTEYVGLRFDGTDVSVVLLSALTGAPITIPRTSWIDPLDGTGPSGFTIDWTTFNTFEASGATPGAGGGYASINEVRILEIPAFANASAALKYIHHPLRATITNTGPSAAGHIRIKSFTIEAVGAYMPEVLPSPAPISPVTRTVGVGGLPVLSIRAKTTLGGQPWRGILLPKSIDLAAQGGRIRWQLIENPSSLTGASWVSAGSAIGMEFDVSATAVTIGTGRVIANGTLASSVDSKTIDLTALFEEHLSHAIRVRVDGVSDVLVLFVAATLGSADVTSNFIVDVEG